jgi:hypothetical protein
LNSPFNCRVEGEFMTTDHVRPAPVRRIRQNVAIFAVASLVGVWLGATAPETSPGAPPVPAATTTTWIDAPPREQRR